MQDIICGKMGEIAAYMFLKDYIPNLGKPDFNIYHGRKKSFDSDLAHEKLHLHVKSQTQESANRYGISCLFQYNGFGTGHTDKIFKVEPEELESHYLILTTVAGKEVDIQGIWCVRQMMENGLFEEPRLNWFKKTKKAVYKKSLDAKLENLIDKELL